jgi:sporulation protein YlmC with PRC-barrel domain
MRKELIAAVSAFALMTGAAFAQSPSPAGNANQSGEPSAAPTSPAPATGTDMSAPAERSATEAPAGMAQTASAEELMGKTVYGDDNKKIGEVEDVILDSNGKAQQLILSSGGFLGIGAKQVAVDFNKATLDPNQDRVQVSGMSQQDIESLPEFEYSDSMISLNRNRDKAGSPTEPMNAPPPAAPAPADRQ